MAQITLKKGVKAVLFFQSGGQYITIRALLGDK